MDVLKKYSIAFKGLGEGTHRFDMKVDDRFFEAFEGSEIRRGNADVRLTLDKRGNGMALDFDIRGEVAVECDRCLEEFMMPVRYEGTLHVRYSDCERESDGEVMWISPSETELNVAQYIYAIPTCCRASGSSARKSSTACVRGPKRTEVLRGKNSRKSSPRNSLVADGLAGQTDNEEY